MTSSPPRADPYDRLKRVIVNVFSKIQHTTVSGHLFGVHHLTRTTETLAKDIVWSVTLSGQCIIMGPQFCVLKGGLG